MNLQTIQQSMLKYAALLPGEMRLRRLAKPLYVEHGRNSWDHIKQVLDNAEQMTKSVDKRSLTLQEKAAILFHDCAVKANNMSHKNHGRLSAEMAIPLLLSTGIFNDKDLDTIGTAIREHDELDGKGAVFSSTVGDVLASGDADPPDLPWLLNKMYCWRIQNMPGQEDKWKQDIWDTATEGYGEKSKDVYPERYMKFHGKRLADERHQISNSTPDELWQMALAYRRKHRLGAYEVKFPDPPKYTN